MGNRSSLLLRKDEIAQIRNETGFTANQIERLYSRFTSLDRGDLGTLSREDLLRIPELAINPLGERIVDLFHTDSGNNKGRINFLQFMRVLSKFRLIKPHKENKQNNHMEKIKFAFDMYDVDNDGMISKDELLIILHMMVGANISEEQLSIIADKTISEADIDGDGLISFEEFSKTFEKSDIENKMSIRFLN
ncbi:calcineurin B homologous protein 1 [Daktulosphaira vitifoliae]|uniref:Calcineurin b subunit n=1 Tax=Daktulosphaira vitifoliae TaxID=58002 RepID=A0A481SVE2_DAKVI|nr:calcineurin B homologous protein 1 [Daktulosphaira vitifoliae]QBH72770.1 calcineurin b subunit [Daktulosphaira vitifoliae]